LVAGAAFGHATWLEGRTSGEFTVVVEGRRVVDGGLFVDYYAQLVRRGSYEPRPPVASHAPCAP
jgi:hypothetical protein